MEYTIEEKCNNVVITLDGDFDNPNYDNFSYEMDKKGYGGVRLYVDKTNTNAQRVYSKLGMNGEHYQLFEYMAD